MQRVSQTRSGAAVKPVAWNNAGGVAARSTCRFTSPINAIITLLLCAASFQAGIVSGSVRSQDAPRTLQASADPAVPAAVPGLRTARKPIPLAETRLDAAQDCPSCPVCALADTVAACPPPPQCPVCPDVPAAPPAVPTSSTGTCTDIMSLHDALGAVDPCAYPPAFRPPLGSEWLDRPVVEVVFPVPPGSAPLPLLRAYDTRYPGSSSKYFDSDFWSLVNAGTWEADTMAVFRDVLSAKKAAAQQSGGKAVLIDFGSWIGVTGLYGSLWADDVYMLEPDPRAFSEAWANVRLNPELARKVRVFHHCISTTSETVTMSGTLGSSMSRVGSDHGAGFHTTWEVSCSSLPDFVTAAGIQPPDIALIKIDTEGAELRILPALTGWLQAAFVSVGLPKPPIWLSTHPGMWPSGAAESSAGASLMEVIASYKHVYAWSDTERAFRAEPVTAAGGGRSVISLGTILLSDTDYPTTS